MKLKLVTAAPVTPRPLAKATVRAHTAQRVAMREALTSHTELNLVLARFFKAA